MCRYLFQRESKFLCKFGIRLLSGFLLWNSPLSSETLLFQLPLLFPKCVFFLSLHPQFAPITYIMPSPFLFLIWLFFLSHIPGNVITTYCLYFFTSFSYSASLVLYSSTNSLAKTSNYLIIIKPSAFFQIFISTMWNSPFLISRLQFFSGYHPDFLILPPQTF